METLIDDMAWCWWTRPRATRIGDVVYLGALDSRGHIVAATWDLSKRLADRTELARFEGDDHNNPALVAVPDRPLVAFYTRHGIDDALRLRVSTRPTDIGDWHDERVLSFGGSTTYAQVHPRGDELHLFTRVAETSWGYRRSRDWAATWDPPRSFLAFDTDQQIYMPTVMLDDQRTVRVAVSGHPKEYESKPLHDVWVCVLDLETGDVSRPGDGAVIANVHDGTGLPLNYDQLELVYATPPDRTVNIFDVGDGPHFEIGFVSKVKDDHSTADARYHVTSNRNGHWITDDVVPAGDRFGYIHAGLYVGGMAFPHRSPGDQVFLTREHDGRWHLERWDRGPGGTWSSRPLIAQSATRLTRPWAVTDPAGGLDVVVLALERYPEDDYFGWLSHLVGAGADGPYPA
jgi:BNR repeat-containing family member